MLWISFYLFFTKESAMGTAWLGAWFVNHATSRDNCVVHATEHGVYFEPCHPLFSFKLTFDFFKNRPISQNCLLSVTWQVTFKITKKAIVLVNESEICSCFSIIFVFFKGFPVAVQVIKYWKTHQELIPPNKMAQNHPREIELDCQVKSTWQIVAIVKGKHQSS